MNSPRFSWAVKRLFRLETLLVVAVFCSLHSSFHSPAYGRSPEVL